MRTSWADLAERLWRVQRWFFLLAILILAIGCTQAQHAQRTQERTPRPAELAKPPKSGPMVMEVTAYCPCRKCCGSKARGITASGQRVSYHHQTFVSADTRVLPFYTWVVVPGYNQGKPVPVIDRGGTRVGNRIDVFFPTHEQAQRWGRQTLRVQVVPAPAKG